MRITVYCGSVYGARQSYREAAEALGRWIGVQGHTLVYGGSKCGLMGVIADAVLDAGGKVVGVEPQFFLEQGLDHDRITELIAVETISERRAHMLELGDAFVALPGGTGTLEEISEVISLCRLERIRKPYVFFNVDGFYDKLRSFFEDMVREQMLEPASLARIRFADTLEGVTEVISEGGKQEDGETAMESAETERLRWNRPQRKRPGQTGFKR